MSLTVPYVCLLLVASMAGQQCKNVRVANVKSIFAIAPSPVASNVLFYASAEEGEGEIVTGNLFRLRLSGEDRDVVQLKAPGASNPSAPVWKPDGSVAYFETDQGIYQLNSTGDSPGLLWEGPSAGLAISPDGLLLAFWLVDKGEDTLVLYDLNKKSESRRWRVPDRFESDKSGWSLAFAPVGHALYARTYDQTSSTPLRRFDVTSGNVSLVSPNSYAVAGCKEAVYFIAVSDTARSLRKITTGGHSSVVAKEFNYDSLSGSGNSHWLVSQDYRSKEMAVLDTESDAVKPIGKYEFAVMLFDGELLRVKGSEMTIGNLSCKASSIKGDAERKHFSRPLGGDDHPTSSPCARAEREG